MFHNFDERYPGAVVEAAPKVDARIRRSRLRLRQALVELVLERGYDAVTIRDIARRADVGYATFFRHFEDKDALLGSLLDELLDELLSLLAPSLADDDASRTGAFVFEHVRQNADLYRVLISSQRSVDLVSRAALLGESEMRRDHAPSEDALLPPDAAMNHLVRSVIALIDWWLGAGMLPDPQRMGKAFEVLIMAPVRAVAFRRLRGSRSS